MGKLKETQQCVLLTRLSIVYLGFRIFSIRNRDTAYFFDPHARSHGLTTQVLIRVLGNKRFSCWIERACRCFGLSLYSVPHGDMVKDYHVLHVQMLKHQMDILKLYNDCAPECDLKGFLPKETIDAESERGWALQEISFHLRHVIENILVLQKIGAKDLTVWIADGEYTQRLVDIISKRFGITFSHSLFDDRFVVLGSIIPFLAFRFWRNLRRVTLNKHSRPPAAEGAKKLAVELIDPLCAGSRPCEPKFLVNKNFPEERLLAYYRGPHLWRKVEEKEFEIEWDMEVIGLHKLSLTRRNFKIFIGSIFQILKECCFVRIAPYKLLKEVENIQYFIELNELFEQHRIGAHLYLPISDGRAPVNYCSGVPTAACRRSGVISIGYQTRICYVNDTYLFLNVFDAFFVWGKISTPDEDILHFTRRHEIIGCVYLDSHRLASNSYTSREIDSIDLSQPIKLVLFTGDIDAEVPLHYTRKYTIAIMKFWLAGIRASASRHPKRQYHIYLKPKQAHHDDIIFKHLEIRDLIDPSCMEIHTLKLEKHDVVPAIEMADAVFAIGFTSPGMEAILNGQPAAYLTPHSAIYRGAYSEKNPWILRTKEEVAEFLDNLSVDPSSFSEIDPYCDGRAAERLTKYYLDELVPSVELERDRSPRTELNTASDINC